MGSVKEGKEEELCLTPDSNLENVRILGALKMTFVSTVRTYRTLVTHCYHGNSVAYVESFEGNVWFQKEKFDTVPLVFLAVLNITCK